MSSQDSSAFLEMQKVHTLLRGQRLAEARMLLERICHSTSANLESWYLLGAIHQEQNNLPQAVNCYTQALIFSPDHADTHYYLGNALRELGDIDKAIEHYRDTIATDPGHIEAHCNLGASHEQRGEDIPALECYQHALHLAPHRPELHYNVANVLKRLGRRITAEQHYRRALALKPDFAVAYNNLGNVLEDSGQAVEALECYRRAVSLKPDYAEALCNLATAFRDRGDLDEAMLYYQKAQAVDGDYPRACLGIALLQLLTGDFAHGWEAYESRWRVGSHPPRIFRQPLWNGESLGGRRILFHAEQGLGDTIHFVRYASLVRQRGGRVILECQPGLARLLRYACGVDEVIVAGDPLPPFDTHLPLLSLPRVLQTTLDNIPADVPYVNLPAKTSADVSVLLRAGNGNRRIGIVWAGSESNPNDRNRSCPPTYFKTVAEQRGIVLYSLQKGPRGLPHSDVPDLPVTDLSSLLVDFYDTAMVIRHLDLIITVDTAVAHLAGALGRPVWVLLPFAPDWRWLLNREDSPWYPSMRLFRQTSPGDWASVFSRITEAIKRT